MQEETQQLSITREWFDVSKKVAAAAIATAIINVAFAIVNQGWSSDQTMLAIGTLVPLVTAYFKKDSLTAVYGEDI